MQTYSDDPATIVTLASLLKLVNLLGAELTIGRHREDIGLIEHCVRSKLFAHVDGVSPMDHAAGVALAHSLVEPVLKNLRQRAENLPRKSIAHALAVQTSRSLH